MLNVKKYRATTTREALEMIKQELGADAFVLDTKKVRTGGFLGFRSKGQVEVSAAAPALSADGQSKDRPKRGIPSPAILNLTDDTPAAPPQIPTQTIEGTYGRKEMMISALSARAASSQDFETASSSVAKAIDKATTLKANTAIETVEISHEAPRLVHPRKETSRIAQGDLGLEPVNDQAQTPAASSSREFDLLRAELREVKFSLGAFANRQNTSTWEEDIDLNIFGEVFDAPLHSVYLELIATGMTADFARKCVGGIMAEYKQNPQDTKNLTRTALLRVISSLIRFQADPLKGAEAATMAVIGATGVGKTTTVAKLAARMALYEQRRVELVTLDTYRIAAVEQLKTYAEIIGAGCHVVRSVLELDAVLRRMPADATVLIDTTGRNPHDLADQYELSDYLLQRKNIRKCLAVQATTHPIDASAAIKKFEMYGADCLALTKVDETMRLGSTIELIAENNLPLAFLCTGQRVPEDLQDANAQTYTDRVLGK